MIFDDPGKGGSGWAGQPKNQKNNEKHNKLGRLWDALGLIWDGLGVFSARFRTDFEKSKKIKFESLELNK